MEGWNTLERLEYGAGRLDYSTVKQVEGWSTVQEAGVLYSAGGRLKLRRWDAVLRCRWKDGG